MREVVLCLLYANIFQINCNTCFSYYCNKICHITRIIKKLKEINSYILYMITLILIYTYICIIYLILKSHLHYCIFSNWNYYVREFTRAKLENRKSKIYEILPVISK